MTQKAYNIISNIFPVGGGSAGALSQVNEIHYFPAWEVIISAIIMAAIGATVGYFLKILFDIIIEKLKLKFRSKKDKSKRFLNN
jgi:hypothetical protein